MRKNVIIVLLGVLTLALLVVAIQQNRQLQDVKGMAGVEEPETTAVANAVTPRVEKEPMADSERAQYEETIRQLRSQLAPTQAASEKPKTSPMEGMAEMLKNPGMRDLIRAQQEATMELTYESLLKYL